jgi:hypothetical protein
MVLRHDDQASCMIVAMAVFRGLMMRPDDDVAVLLDDARAGDFVEVGEAGSVTLVEAIPQGHKLAVHDIGKGTEVRKYGSTIGLATVPIAAGSHVHVHNVESGRLRGDK